MSGFNLVADGLYRREICLSLLKDHVPISLCTFLANNFSACFESLDKYVFSEGDSVDLPSETAHGIEAYHVVWPAVSDTMDPEVMVDVTYPFF